MSKKQIIIFISIIVSLIVFFSIIIISILGYLLLKYIEKPDKVINCTMPKLGYEIKLEQYYGGATAPDVMDVHIYGKNYNGERVYSSYGNAELLNCYIDRIEITDSQKDISNNVHVLEVDDFKKLIKDTLSPDTRGQPSHFTSSAEK